MGWRTKKRGQALANALGGGEVFYCRARSGFDLAIISRSPARNAQAPEGLGLFHGLLSLEVEIEPGTWARLHAAHLSPTREGTREEEIQRILGTLGPRDGVPQAILGDFNGIRVDDTVEGVPVKEVPPGVGPVWRQDKVPPRAIDGLQQEGWIDLYRELHPGEEGYTFPSREPVARYDYVFSNETFRERVGDVDVLRGGEWPSLSDHLPLLITLR